MKKFVIIAGLNDKETKKQEISTENAHNIIVKVLYNNGVEGATFTEAKGLYIHRDGTAVFETSIKIELLFITEATAREIAEQIRIELNQESTVLEIQNLDSELIEEIK
jgi:hypothetical protein